MERFAAGNRAFREGYFSEHTELFLQLLQGQHPVALYVGCSDSRVPIEQIANALPGDLFVVRTVGGIVPPSYYGDAGMGAAVERAVDHLHVPHAVVCGHYGCGSIAALVESETSSCGLSLPLSIWLSHARPILGRVVIASQATDEERSLRLRRLAEENVRLQVEHLRTYNSVKEAEAAGRLRVHAWLYDWDTGALLEDRDGAFGLLG
jgi:carbonic anhydrase